MAGCVTTAYCGKFGSITSLGSPPSEIKGWTLDPTIDLLEANFLGVGSKQWCEGLTGGTGTIEAQGKIPFTVGSSAQVVFPTGTGTGDCKATCDIKISSAPINCMVADRVGYTCNFTVCGDINWDSV